MRFTIRQNDDLEAFDIIDEHSNQSHDSDCACELIASVYDIEYAERIRMLLEVFGLSEALEEDES